MGASQSDTTTVLNPGAAGDSMGESSVPRMDTGAPSLGVSFVKQPRVVITDEDARILAAPMSEGTGQQILTMLSAMNDKLAMMAGTLS